jgi:hypothetical protein
MKLNIFRIVGITIVGIGLGNTKSEAQIADTTLIRKLSINGICLCNATLPLLKQQYADLKKVDVEEMDLPKNCIGQDSRFVAGVGFSSERYPGMIFQKDQNTDQISKIRLTKQFKGKLPDGKFINVNGLTLKDLFSIYPKLKSAWGSRGCSNYWKFSNDTLSFYVKIDANKKPQFPIDEAYYAVKPIEAVDFVVSCYSFQENASKTQITLFNPDDPVMFLDSIRINRGVLSNFTPSEIASLTVYKGNDAIKLVGAEGKNGVVYIETKNFARQRYWTYFKSKSVDYLKAVPSPKNDSSVQYILNKRVLKENYEADLTSIDDKTFKSISIIDKEQMVKNYGITDKNYGVVIVADVAVKK